MASNTRSWARRLKVQRGDVGSVRTPPTLGCSTSERSEVIATGVAAFLLSRILVLGIAAISALNRGEDVASALRAWDGDWFLSAASGYSTTAPDPTRPWQLNIAFFPVLPLSIRFVAMVTGLNVVDAGIVAVHLYGFVLAILLGAFACRLSDASDAKKFCWLFWLFPGSAVLSLTYSEVAMLTWSSATILALLSRRWLGAGCFAALSAATRPNGVVLVFCCLWAAISAIRERREWRALVAPLIAPLGVLAYFAYLWRTTGDPFVWFKVQANGWQARADFGTQAARQVVSLVRDPTEQNMTSFLQLFSLVVAIIGLVLLLQWRPPSIVSFYTIAMLALPILTTTESAAGPRPRFILLAFPIFLAFAQRLGNVAASIASVASAALLAATAVVYTTPLWVIP
jgi:hypothetical protein